MNDNPNINVSEGKCVTFSEDEYEAKLERETILRFGKAISQGGKIIFKIWELDDLSSPRNSRHSILFENLELKIGFGFEF